MFFRCAAIVLVGCTGGAQSGGEPSGDRSQTPDSGTDPAPDGGTDPAPDGGTDPAPDGATTPASGSDGCGASSSPGTGTYFIDVKGTSREYSVSVPDGYDPAAEHKLILVWHGLGGSAAQTASNFQGVGNHNDGSAIFVAGQGLLHPNPLNPDGPSASGWPDDNGEDVDFVRALLTELRSLYCIDNNRIFSTGASYGGIMSNRLGCELGDDLRAIAPIMGTGPEGWYQDDCSLQYAEANCTGEVAAWITHGSADTTVRFCQGEKSRDYWEGANSCAPDTTGIGPDNCVEYTGCNAGYPVVWCPTDLGHRSPSFSGEEIWKFFSRF
jgi:poly(3-hydroxybutyrate) depolymerase